MPADVSQKTVIGWREWVGLPDLGIPSIKAKIDTGARTTAIHSLDHEIVDINGEEWVEFCCTLDGVTRAERSRAKLVDRRDIRNTSGIPETRLIVETTLRLGERTWPIEVSLADRDLMKFDMILGRTAIRGHGILVNPGRSFLTGGVPSTDSDEE